MSSFYKMEPAAWDFGTADLTLEQEAAYLRIVNAIHKHDQPVPDNDRVLAGMFRCSTRKARALVAALVEAGKIQIEGGRISNEKAISDLVRRGFVTISRAEAGAKGGRTRAENARNALECNDQGQANASTREEKRREEIGGGGNAREESGFDPDFRESLLTTIGVDPVSGLTGIGGATLGTRYDMERAAQWQADLGLDQETIIAVLADTMAKKRDGPPNTFRYFDQAMQRAAARKREPKLTPIEGGNHDRQSSRDRREAAASDATTRQIAFAARARRTPGSDCF